MNKAILLAGNILAGVIFIILQNTGVFPLDTDHFIFFSFVVFLFALYRPSYAFLLFIGMLPFETIITVNLLDAIGLRPYQWLSALIMLSVALRVILGKLPFKLFRPTWHDIFLPLVLIGALLATTNAPAATGAMKQAIVLTSFVALYFLGRIFIRTIVDIKQLVPFFLSSSLVVFAYSVWQNIRFGAGKESYEVMAGRPNATFSEADWLGLYAVFVLVIVWSLLIALLHPKRSPKSPYEDVIVCLKHCAFWGWLVLQTGTFIVLLIAVSRSAWLAATAVFVTLIAVSLVYHRKQLHTFLSRVILFGINMGVALWLAVFLIAFFNLTTFSLFERAESTAGLQKITVACETKNPGLPETIENTQALSTYKCVHINLEDIEKEKLAGKFVMEVNRPDPNVSIRKKIYGEVWDIIRAHPITGIGWGSAAVILGTDERGAGLNASNMFLEVWLGSGIIGFIVFVALWVFIGATALYGIFLEPQKPEHIFSFFVFSGWVAITVFNMFNSGMLLGFFFLYLTLGILNAERVVQLVKNK